MQISPKIIKVRGRDVLVSAKEGEEGQHFKLLADCAGVVREHSLTIGPAEGAGPERYDQAMLQRDLDLAREKIAAEAEWHVRVRKMIDLAT